jgi:hypothetical protein
MVTGVIAVPAVDTATVVIAVGISDINLALGKPATQSSTYLYMTGSSSVRLKAFKEIEKMAIARSLVSLFFMFKK